MGCKTPSSPARNARTTATAYHSQGLAAVSAALPFKTIAATNAATPLRARADGRALTTTGRANPGTATPSAANPPGTSAVSNPPKAIELSAMELVEKLAAIIPACHSHCTSLCTCGDSRAGWRLRRSIRGRFRSVSANSGGRRCHHAPESDS